MPFTYPQVSVAGNDYNAYGDEADAQLYLAASVTAATFNALTDDDAIGALLISAVRWLDSLQWLGSQTDPTQALQWPRINIPNVSSSTIPPQIALAEFELAAGLADDPTLQTSLGSPLPKQLKAGSAELAFFRPHNVQILTPVPQNVMALIGQWLQSVSPAGGPTPKGVHRKGLHDDFGFNHGI